MKCVTMGLIGIYHEPCMLSMSMRLVACKGSEARLRTALCEALTLDPKRAWSNVGARLSPSELLTSLSAGEPLLIVSENLPYS